MSFFQAHVSVSADLVKANIKFITIDEIQSGSLFCNWDYIGSEYSVTSVERSLKFSANVSRSQIFNHWSNCRRVL